MGELEILRDAIRPPEMISARIVETLVDAEGRPLGELGLLENGYSLPTGCPFSTKVCRYPGSRAGLEMNISALEQITRHWPAALAETGRLRRFYREYTGRDVDTYFDLLVFSKIACALPAYLTRRRALPVGEGEMPGDLASLYKAILGVAITAVLVLEQEDDLAVGVTADNFYERSERYRSFLGGTGLRACAGPPHMIREYIDVLAEQGGRGDSDVGGSAALVGALEPAFRYGEALNFIDTVYLLNQHQVHLLALDLRRDLEAVSLASGEGPSRLSEAVEGLPWSGRTWRQPEVAGLPARLKNMVAVLRDAAVRLTIDPRGLEPVALAGDEGEALDEGVAGVLGGAELALSPVVARLIERYVVRQLRCERVAGQLCLRAQAAASAALGRADEDAVTLGGLDWLSIFRKYVYHVPSPRALWEAIAGRPLFSESVPRM